MSFTKTCRKLCCFIAFVLAFCFLVGCTVTPGTPSEREINKKAAEEAVSEITKGILWDPTSMNAITSASLSLPTTTKYDNVVISWESSEEDVIASDGTVTRVMYDDPRAVLVDGSEVVKVTLTATVTGTYSYTSGEEVITNEVKETKDFNFTVKCLKPEIIGTIAECKAAAWEHVFVKNGVQKELTVSASDVTYNVRFTGIVTGKLLNGGKGITVHDGTEGIYIYTNNEGFEIGDTVDVVGNIYAYYCSLQVGSEITIKKVDAVEGMKIGEYREVTVQEWEDEQKDIQKAAGYFGGKLLKVYAKLEKDTENDKTSDVYKLIDPYTGEVAWVYYKSYEKENTELDAWDGKYVYIYGASYDRDSRLNKNHLLWDGRIEEAPAPELTEAQKVDQVKAVLNGLAGDHVSGTKLTLPTSNEEYGATISWKLSDETLLTNGVFAIVEADTKLTATATITVGETTVEYAVEMTVLKLTTYTVAAASKLEAGTVVKLVGTVEVVYSKYNNFYLKDATGNLLVYKSLPEGIKLGDKIELVGTMGYYNGTPQIASIISATLVSAAEWEMSAPKEMSIAEIVAFDEKTALYGQYIYAKGLLVKSGNYYYLADATDPSIRISLYNSTVAAEELVAVADTDTQVTLFFYFYGNSKGNWAEGEKRVIFVQREGEYFIGDEEVILPETRTYQTLAEAKAMVDQEVTVRGVVTAVSPYSEQYGNFGVLIEDATDGLYLYRVAGTDAYAQFVIGQEIEVTGTMDQYNGLYEMKDVQMDTFKVINEKATIPGPTPMSNELQDQCKVVELKEAVWNGSAFEKDGSTYAYFYSSSWLAEQPELVKGATYTVIGWLNWYNNPQISPLQAPELVAEAPAHEHTECPECGKCTAEDCDGTEADKCAGHEEEPEQPEQPEVEGSVKYTFADLTGKGTELTASSALSIFGTENGLTSVTVTKVYNGNGDGGAYPQTAGFLKFGTSKANGVLTLNFAEGTKVTKVVINCHDWYKKSASYPTNSNKVSVNGSTAVLAPYTEDGTPGDLTFELEATNKVEITSALRVFVFSITVYFEGAETPEQPEAPKHEHTECPECGKCTAEDCDGTEADKCAGHEEEPEQPEQPEVEGSVKYTFADLTGKGTELTASSALSIFGTENGLTSVTVTKVYNGNGDGGAYPQTAGFLKFGTSKANGVLTLNFAEGTKVTKVVINCHDWYKKSASYPTNSNKVSVNGSTAVLAPYTEDGTPGDLTFELEATNKVEITSALRVFVFSITVYFGE